MAGENSTVRNTVRAAWLKRFGGNLNKSENRNNEELKNEKSNNEELTNKHDVIKELNNKELTDKGLINKNDEIKELNNKELVRKRQKSTKLQRIKKQKQLISKDDVYVLDETDVSLSSLEKEEDDDIEIISERTIAISKKPNNLQQIVSPVKMFRTNVLPQKDTISIIRLFPKTVYKTYQFSMQIDLDFFIPIVMLNTLEPPEMIFITKDLFAHEKYNAMSQFQGKLKYVHLHLPKWTLHHSKMMINFHSTGMGTSEKSNLFVQIVVMTCNMTFFEFSYMGSCYWKSPMLPLMEVSKTTNKPQPFKDDLITYLKQYKRSEINLLIVELSKYDFSSIQADFIGCVPGSGHDSKTFGYGKLDAVLTKYNLKQPPPTKRTKPFQILSHMSSMAGPYKYKPEPSNIFTHIICPIAAGLKFPLAAGAAALKQNKESFNPIVLFPTKKDILRAEGGPRLTGSFIFHNTSTQAGKEQYNSLTKDIFYKRDIANEQRSHPEGYKQKFINNHTKVYMCSDDYSEGTSETGAKCVTFNSLKWFMMGSFNLSKSAWGQPGSNGSWKGGNWEVGVVIHPEHYRDQFKDKNVILRPVWNTNNYNKDSTGRTLGGSDNENQINIPIRLPFGFPVIKCQPDLDEVFTEQDLA